MFMAKKRKRLHDIHCNGTVDLTAKAIQILNVTKLVKLFLAKYQSF